MTRFTVSVNRCFDRPWRSGHPFRPRCGKFRRAAMLVLLVIFAFIIGGYNYLTDAHRVRKMAEDYLSEIVGGKVEVQSATLSIFEGLRVDGVKVFVDRYGDEAPDSLIFSAQSFVLKYDPRTLLAGQIDASQIIAQKPHVYLTEDLDHPGEWNFHRLGRGHPDRATTRSDSEGKPIPLPEVLLRNAKIEVGALHDGQVKTVSYMAIDGQLTPTPVPNHFRFEMQGWGKQGRGPYATGIVSLNTKDLQTAELHDFDFSRDLRSMLPNEAREWWERHALGGQIEKLRVMYQAARKGQRAKFNVDMILGGVTISVPPEDWMAGEEVRQLRQKRQAVDLMQGMYSAAGLEPHNPSGATVSSPTTNLALTGTRQALDMISDAIAPPPIRLEDGHGHFLFTEQGILLQSVTGKVENNSFEINGHIDGYNPDAPASLTITSLPGKDIYIPPNPRWANSLPAFIRNIYQDIRPTGHCNLELHVDRPRAGIAPIVSGRVDITNGEFCYRQFAYPVRDASGTIAFGPDPARNNGFFVRIINFKGRGKAGGPNENMFVLANGEIGPLGPRDPQVKVIVSGKGICSEPALVAAYPWEIRDALSIFDADKKGLFPQYRGNFELTLIHHADTGKWTFDTDVDLLDASGKVVGFPYPLSGVSGKFKVRDGYVDILNATMHRGDGASMNVYGRVCWGEGHDTGFKLKKDEPVHDPLRVLTHNALSESSTKIDLHIFVHDLPIDSRLVDAIPPEHAVWIKRLGLGGRLDVEGRIIQGISPQGAMVGPADIGFPSIDPRPVDADPDRINFDLGIALSHGTFWPADGTFSVADVNGRMRLWRDGMELYSLEGRRDKSVLTADGSVQWADGSPRMMIHATGKDLMLDASLYSMLPADARGAWDQVQPHGAVDAELTWGGRVNESSAEMKSAPAGQRASTQGELPVASIDEMPVLPPATQASDRTGFRAVIKPKGIVCIIHELPYRLENVTGIVTIDHGHITLKDIKGFHGKGHIVANGTGNLDGPRPIWEIALSGKSIDVNDEFRNAVPSTVQSLIDSLKLRGTIDFEFPRLSYRGEMTTHGQAPTIVRLPSPVAVQPVALVSPSDPVVGEDLDLSSIITLHGGSLDAGVPMENVNGQFNINAAVRDGKLSTFDGSIDIDRLTLSGRKVTDLRGKLTKAAGSSELVLDKIQANVADGQLVGQLHLLMPDVGPSKYTLGLVLRNADVKTLAGGVEKDLRGQLTASISLEGAWGDASLRRGRGDVTVSGKDLYHMPLILGLVQVTNLSLPIGSPFNQGLARYSVEGQRVNFERIELKSDNMMMSGGGHLDFAKKQVQMTFITDSPGGFKIPFFNDIWQGARQELFKINIRGSIQQPRVEANPFGTFTTTIDEVLNGDGKKQ